MSRWLFKRFALLAFALAVTSSVAGTAHAAVGWGSGFVRTPWSRGASVEEPLTCGSCQKNSTNVRTANKWQWASKGRYFVTFPGLAPEVGAKAIVHVTPLNSPGVSCAVTDWGPMGNDYRVGVSCWKLDQPVDTRFMVRLQVASDVASGLEEGFASVFSGSISNGNSWVSKGTTPTMSSGGTGVYSIWFPGLGNNSAGGNAQVTSNNSGVTCRLTGWSTVPAGTQVSVLCETSSLQATNASFMVSFDQEPSGSSGHGLHFFADQPSFAGSYTPRAFYMSRRPVTVRHSPQAPGQYFISFGSNTSTTIVAQVTAWNGSANCSIADFDEYSTHVICVNPVTGQPEDNVFSFELRDESTNLFYGFAQIPVAGTNWSATSFDVGNGLICGEGATGQFLGRVACVAPAAPGSTSPMRLIGGGPPPGGIKSIAIDNVDATWTRILVLGSDSVVRVSSGDLSQAWPSSSNFATWEGIYAAATTLSGQSVSLKKIVVVRTLGASGTSVLALTNAGRILQLTTVGRVRGWEPASSQWPGTNAWFKDISHGRHDLYALRTDNVMLRISLNSAVSAPNILPPGLLPVAIGGRHVLTNSGLSGGRYPCALPKDGQGFYTCAGDDERVYHWNVNNTGGNRRPFRWPTTNHDDVLTSGQPFVSITPRIVDADLFEGNQGSFVAWQYFSRLYQRVP